MEGANSSIEKGNRLLCENWVHTIMGRGKDKATQERGRKGGEGGSGNWQYTVKTEVETSPTPPTGSVDLDRGSLLICVSVPCWLLRGLGEVQNADVGINGDCPSKMYTQDNNMWGFEHTKRGRGDMVGTGGSSGEEVIAALEKCALTQQYPLTDNGRRGLPCARGLTYLTIPLLFHSLQHRLLVGLVHCSDLVMFSGASTVVVGFPATPVCQAPGCRSSQQVLSLICPVGQFVYVCECVRARQV
jgi:hypothetical protein